MAKSGFKTSLPSLPNELFLLVACDNILLLESLLMHYNKRQPHAC